MTITWSGCARCMVLGRGPPTLAPSPVESCSYVGQAAIGFINPLGGVLLSAEGGHITTSKCGNARQLSRIANRETELYRKPGTSVSRVYEHRVSETAGGQRQCSQLSRYAQRHASTAIITCTARPAWPHRSVPDSRVCFRAAGRPARRPFVPPLSVPNRAERLRLPESCPPRRTGSMPHHLEQGSACC